MSINKYRSGGLSIKTQQCTSRRKGRLISCFRLVLALFVSVFLSGTVANQAFGAFSIPPSTLNFFGLNGIYYYNPFGSNQSSCTIATGSYDGNTSAGLSSQQSAFVDKYHDIAQQLSVEYGIPWEAVMAQGILESAAGTSNFAVNRNNFFGIGAFDSNPNNAFSYPSPEAGWRGYYENIRKTATYRNHGVFKEPTITDPYAYIAAVKAAGYATDPNYVPKVSSLIRAIENRAQSKNWFSSKDLAQKYPNMISNAASYAAGSGTIASSNASFSSSACIYTGGNGDINQTALDLAWPDRTHSYDDPRPSYKAALQDAGFASYSTTDPDIPRGSSCDVFVSTVMRVSGVDPNYPRFLGGQENYMRSHSELYQYVGVATNSSIARPGDIRVSNGHIEIVIQKSDGSLGIASASHSGTKSAARTASLGGWYNDPDFRIYRHI